MEKQGRPVIASQFGTGRVLTDAMTIRRKVFMIEENVSEKDEIDGRDDRCLHYVFYVDNWYPCQHSTNLFDWQKRLAYRPRRYFKNFSWSWLRPTNFKKN